MYKCVWRNIYVKYIIRSTKNWYCHGICDLAYLGCTVVFTELMFTLILKQVDVTHLPYLQHMFTQSICDWQSHWQLKASHLAEFRFSSICSIFRSTRFHVFLTELNFRLEGWTVIAWQSLSFVKFLKQSTFLVISTSEAHFRTYDNSNTLLVILTTTSAFNVCDV